MLDSTDSKYKFLNDIPKRYANALGYSYEDDLYKYSEEYTQKELFEKIQAIKKDVEKPADKLNNILEFMNENSLIQSQQPIANFNKVSNQPIIPTETQQPDNPRSPQTAVKNTVPPSTQSSYRSTISNTLWTAGGYFLSELITNAMRFYNKPDTALMKNIGFKNLLPLFGIMAFQWKLAPDVKTSERCYSKTACALGFAGGIGWKLKSYLPTQNS